MDNNEIINFSGLDIAERKTPAKKPASSSKKKKTASAKKKKTATSIRLSAAEKKLVQNYRKSNLIEKKILDFAAEKFAEGADTSGVLNLLRGMVQQ